MRGLEALQDETGAYSFARVQATVSCLMVCGLTTYLTLKTGTVIAIPESWLTLVGISMGGYLGSKGIATVRPAPVQSPEPAPTN